MLLPMRLSGLHLHDSYLMVVPDGRNVSTRKMESICTDISLWLTQSVTISSLRT